MAGEWETGRLADIADLVMGQSPAGETCNENGKGIPLLNGPTEFGGSHPKPVQFTTDPQRFAEPGDLLFCVRGSTTGRMNWADQRYAIGRGLAAIRPKQGSEYRHFVRAVIDVNLPRLLASATGSTFPNVSREQIRAIECNIPPLPEQKAIAHVLGTLDDKIELNRKMNVTLEAMARALFKSWFVDFDPVRAKLDGRQPAGMDAATAALFPSEFQESELGPIPKGWRTSHLEEIANVSSGKRPDGRCDILSPECNIPLYGGGGRMGYVPSALYDKPILFTGRVGTLGLIFRTEQPSWPSDNTLTVEPQSDLFDFTYFVLKGFDLITLNRGSTQPLLTQTDLKQQMLVLPTKDIVKTFSDVSSPLFRQIVSNESESCTLATLRDTLLPKLLSGELSVPEAMKEVANL